MRVSPGLLLLAIAAGCGAGPPGPEQERQQPSAAHPLVATRADLSSLRWLEPGEAPDLGAHRLTLLRWWTVQCQFCRDSLPDLAALQARYGPSRLGLVGVFHQKTQHGPTDLEIVEYARSLGFGGSIACDDRWVALNELRERGALTEATSITVLVDGAGVVQWVHPGPRLHRSADPAFAVADQSFRQLESVLADRLR